MTKGLFHFCRDIRIQFRRQSQITGRVTKRIMTQVGFQNRQIGGQVLALQHPLPQAVNGKGMASIMQPWPLSPAAVRNPGLPQEASEVLVHIAFGERLSTRRRKEIVTRV